MAQFSHPVAALVQPQSEFNLADLQSFINENQHHFITGYLSYSCGEKIHEMNTHKYQPLKNFPGVSLWAFNEVEYNALRPINHIGPKELSSKKLKLHALTTKSTYLEKLSKLKNHIQQGDIYEINFCIGFEAEKVEIDVNEIWNRLQHISPMPFSALVDSDDFAIISASPERFIYRTNNRLYCQPMKGTLAKTLLSKDESIKQLRNNAKERAENVMIVDLTRNDLSRIADPNSVQVDELFGVYEFQTIYQMISTVSAGVKPSLPFKDIIQATFPMGSMTGAPKRRAMQLIHEYEDFSRGVFSGTLGYLNPNGTADFNVLIRTIFYDKREKRLFVAAGSAITSGSDPEKEYEECLIKLQPLLKALHAEI